MSRPYVTSFRAMGNQVNIWLEIQADGVEILQEVAPWFEAIEQCLSRFRSDSELSLLNQHSGTWVQVSDTLLNAILAAQYAAKQTGGLYNPMVLPALVAAGYDRSFDVMDTDTDTPMLAAPNLPAWDELRVDLDAKAVFLPKEAAIDLGGIGKGWVAERIARWLAFFGPCLVDVGGDIVTRGHPVGQDGWAVQVTDPLDDETSILTLQLQDAAVATSGTTVRRWYRNGHLRHHLIDPRTGDPAITDVISATVVHPEASLAEAYTKAVMLLGSIDGLDWLNQQPYAAGIVVCNDGAILSTSDFQSYIWRKS